VDVRFQGECDREKLRTIIITVKVNAIVSTIPCFRVRLSCEDTYAVTDALDVHCVGAEGHYADGGGWEEAGGVAVACREIDRDRERERGREE
jgi:hypothetical protein